MRSQEWIIHKRALAPPPTPPKGSARIETQKRVFSTVLHGITYNIVSSSSSGFFACGNLKNDLEEWCL
ncbi:hypothetical protein Y032_0017g3420 [Ancylostoma ceylanicum]|uniref:Uncharacterized protein n=1 Tax=Ancylostoma ceylanicum TaxID=53326 RepID=A0A016V5P4_9BILA|nr:hypothetical protein Y032_0017g3420 [Ancylostoma ceylanicum]